VASAVDEEQDVGADYSEFPTELEHSTKQERLEADAEGELPDDSAYYQ
jgi:hypothetical protein